MSLKSREIIVRVTATDIRKGRRGRSSSCALARAISRELDRQIWVHDHDFEGRGVEGRLSHDAKQFRWDFDQSKHDVKPSSFCLTIQEQP
jgi:hypothetical protein